MLPGRHLVILHLDITVGQFAALAKIFSIVPIRTAGHAPYLLAQPKEMLNCGSTVVVNDMDA